MTRTTTRDLTGQLDARRAHVHEMWGRVAESWREHATYTDERHADETAALLERAQLRQGHRVLA